MNAPSRRIAVLDVLRGIALLGMFLVHFSTFAQGGEGADGVYQAFVRLMLEERFWAMFAILFGAGFAVQLARSEARGDAFLPRYLRRLATLAVFGFLAHALFGFNVLLGYAVWGMPLLFVRRWSVRALVIATFISASTGAMYIVGRAAYGVATRGEQEFRRTMDENAVRQREFFQTNRARQDATQYTDVVKARLQHMRWFYAQWWSFLPVNTFTLFLLGVLAFRVGLFERPHEHRRIIVGVMAFGAAAWATATWLLPPFASDVEPPVVLNIFLAVVKRGFGLIREMWLAFAYMGIVLLLIARSARWLDRLAVFGWTGRMALTCYMLQIVILDFTFSRYALGLTVTPLVGAATAIALFLLLAVASRAWLSRFQYGPLEWLWRSATLAEWQPMRRETVLFPRLHTVAETEPLSRR